MEIVALVIVARIVTRMLEEKGRRPGWYRVLAGLCWFAGEIVGAFVGMSLSDSRDSALCLAVLFGLGGGAVGAGSVIWYISRLDPVFTEEELQIIEFWSQGLDSSQIAARIQLSDSETSRLTSGLFKKLKADSKAEVLEQAKQQGLVLANEGA